MFDFFKKKLLIFLLLSFGLIPLLWLKPGYIIARGDYFPFWLNCLNTWKSDTYLWNFQNLGHADLFSVYMVYEALWLSLRFIRLDVELIQIAFRIFFFILATLSMYYLAITIYPRQNLTSLIASIFYVFNLFVLMNIVTYLNLGFAWTLAFAPLLMALLIKIVNSECQQSFETLNKHLICFAIISTITVSFASINVANIVVIFVLFIIVVMYYLFTERKNTRLIILNLTKLLAFTILINLWWIIPFLNYYLWSPLIFISQINIAVWSWSHTRASFLNLFWLNGFWGWRPEYFPYYDSYSNPILIILTFIPFFLAATALLFKSEKSRFNTYLMLCILIFIFLAKGLHEPLGQLNLLLYEYIPGMQMFRETVSKFTMAMMPFLALLVGYAVDHIANMKIGKIKPNRFTKTLTTTFFITIFIITAYPLVTNPIETKTEQLPFSSYIKIPDYWYQAVDWLNNQQGDYKILITPPDDHYMMPYTWGYYGTDQFLERLIQKPIISNYYTYSYKINPNTTLALQQLYNSIKYNKTAEFKALLDLLNIKYILQRNDIYWNFTGRKIIPPEEMQTFFTSQPYIQLIQKFGELDIYEYTEPKPYIYTINRTTFQQLTIKIENTTTIQKTWEFTIPTEFQEWQNFTPPNQWATTYTITLDNHALKAELWNSTWGWKTINSPLIPANYETAYTTQLDIKGQNAHEVHIKMAEYDQNKNILTATYTAYVKDGTFNWTHVTFNFEPTNKTTKYIQIQIWHGHETPKPFPNTIWIDNIQIKGYTTTLNTTGLNQIFPNTNQNQTATILNYQKENPTKITAKINATQPFTLAISEALDNQWTAYINGKQIKPTTLYLCITGFQINQTGLLDIVIEYEPQRWFYIGCAISLTTFFACTAYLAYSYVKSKLKSRGGRGSTPYQPKQPIFPSP